MEVWYLYAFKKVTLIVSNMAQVVKVLALQA